jgi:hypothetical protein
VQAVGDLVDLFGSSLMGRDAGGVYYRPLTKLTLALDHAIWGLWAPGYQLGSALLSGAAALAVYALAARLLPDRRRLGALAALAFYVFHPVHATVVPVPARRADVLCVLFTALALAAQAEAVRRGRTRALLPVALVVLALISKETAFGLVALVPLLAFTLSRQGAIGPRLRDAAVSSAPVLLVTGAVLLVRFAVLGNLAGERPFGEEAFLPAALTMLQRVATWSLSPTIWVGERDLPERLLALLATLLVASSLLATREGRASAAAASIPALAVGLAWLGLVTLLYSIGVVLQPWYALHPVAGLALLVGGLVEGLVRLGRSHRRAMASAAAGIACVAILIVQLAAFSPLFRRYDEWSAASAVADRYLAALQRGIAEADTGSVVRASRPPARLPKLPGRPQLAGVTLLAPYSVESWVRLTFPARRIRVVAKGGEPARPRPDEVLVVLGGRARPASRQGK